MHCIYNAYGCCSQNPKAQKRPEAEQALFNDPILVYEQQTEGESRYVYYGETDGGRMLALVVTERNGKIRVVTAYDLDASQKRDYLLKRLGEE